MIDPNTKDFQHYTHDSFLRGWCNDCWTGTVLTDVDKVKNDISKQYMIFKESYGTEPQYADCLITWNNGKQDYMKIMLSAESSSKDDDTSYCCNNLDGLLALAEGSCEKFIVTKCHILAILTKKEELERQIFKYQIEDKTISVTGKEVIDFYENNYGLKKEEAERYAARNTCLIKYYKESDAPLLNHLLVKKLLDKENKMKKGETENFKLQLTFLWHVTIRKEDGSICKPFKYMMNARCLDNIQSFSYRYTTLEEALLHCLNGFNENANIPDRYHSATEYIFEFLKKELGED